VKNGQSNQFEPFGAVYGGNVKDTGNLEDFGGLALLAAGLLLTAGLLLSGCKSTPELTKAQAQSLIQAKYDQTPAAGVNITVDDLGMRQGAAAKYWERTKIYPNRYWADFTLTPSGKQALKLPNGGGVIEWRPESADDSRYSVTVVSVAANHPRARDVNEPQDEVGGKGVSFTESVNLDGVPGPLQEIAHNPGNKLSSRRQAEFVLDGGSWKLASIL
jgi:hypothetical protein